MADKRVVHLKFTTAGGKTASVRINEPREGITLNDAKTVAQAILVNPVLEGSDNTSLQSFKSACEVTTKTVELV